MSGCTLADVCALACAEVWRGDGEILASPIGNLPTIGARLAQATFEPDLVMTDGEAMLTTTPIPLEAAHGPQSAEARKVVEGWVPYRSMFDVVWSGRRHTMMGATQIDMYGNQNISCIGDWPHPRVQLLGVRGAPGNTVNHPTSYWVPSHSKRTFVGEVDMVSGVGYRRAAAAGRSATRFHQLRRVVSNLGVFDFETPDHRMRLVSLHPGVSVDQVLESTGFELDVVTDLQESRTPSPHDLRLISEVLDPGGLRLREVPGR